MNLPLTTAKDIETQGSTPPANLLSYPDEGGEIKAPIFIPLGDYEKTKPDLDLSKQSRGPLDYTAQNSLQATATLISNLLRNPNTPNSIGYSLGENTFVDPFNQTVTHYSSVQNLTTNGSILSFSIVSQTLNHTTNQYFLTGHQSFSINLSNGAILGTSLYPNPNDPRLNNIGYYTAINSYLGPAIQKLRGYIPRQ